LSSAAPLGRMTLAKAIGWSVAFVVLTLLTAGLLGLGVAVVLRGSAEAGAQWLRAGGAGSTLVQALATIVSAGAFTWLIGVRALRLTARDLRYTPAGSALRGLGLGLVLGALTAGAALLISVAAGGARWADDSGTVGDYLEQAFKTAGVLAPAALGEELLFRGVPIVLLAAALGRGAAVVAVAIPFALAHLANPNVTALGVGNIAVAGIFLGLAFYAPGGIWTAFGAHFGWNTLLACLDTPVSGVPFRIPLLDYHAGQPAWLTGGAFGPEGGLGATVALTAAVLVTARWAQKDTV